MDYRSIYVDIVNTTMLATGGYEMNWKLWWAEVLPLERMLYPNETAAQMYVRLLEQNYVVMERIIMDLMFNAGDPNIRRQASEYFWEVIEPSARKVRS
jgi:hypothetical protein